MFGLQPLHILIIIIVALLIFGPVGLPRLGRGLGKSLSDLRQAAKTTPAEFRRGLTDPDDETVENAKPAKDKRA